MPARELLALPFPAGPAVLDLLPALAAALDGSGPAVLPLPPSAARRVEVLGEDDPADLALVVETSGSTGAAKQVLLPGAALRASGEATAAVLGGHGQWLLAVPGHHVAGLQVLARSLLAGTEPVVMDLSDGFTPDRFAAAAALLEAGRRFVSLVPTQLVRLLSDGVDVLRGFDAVLIGGAAAPAALVGAARDAGVHLVTTYGMTETCGGCVYDGRPLPGVEVTLDDDDRVVVCGPVLAHGYRGAEPFDGAFRTSDLGRWRDDGTLEILGRADDVVVTGGEKVAPASVEAPLAELTGVAECAVFGRADARWGQRVVAVVVPTAGDAALLALREVRDALRAALPAAALPRELVVVGSLPLRGPGKVDRRALASLPVGEVLDQGA